MSELLAAGSGASSGSDPVLVLVVIGLIIYAIYYMSKEWYMMKNHPEEYTKMKQAEREAQERSQERYWNNVGKGAGFFARLFFRK